MPRETKRCPHCDEQIDHLDWTADYTEWGRASGTCALDADDECWDDSDSSSSERDNHEYFCPECGEEIDPFNWEEPEEEEGEGAAAAERKPPPILREECDLVEDKQEHSIRIADCPQCKKAFEVERNETELCCPYCGFEFHFTG